MERCGLRRGGYRNRDRMEVKMPHTQMAMELMAP